jgi:hypothetical protein
MVDLEKSSVNINMVLDLKFLAVVIVDQSSIDEIEEFISELDKSCEEWELTERLYKHFAGLHEIYINEVEKED